jgi:hypothetical protein
MSQTTPAQEAQPALPIATQPAGAGPSATPVIAGVTPARVARTRMCVLCGHPLRAGQHIMRVHGSTIHARCSSSGR